MRVSVVVVYGLEDDECFHRFRLHLQSVSVIWPLTCWRCKWWMLQMDSVYWVCDGVLRGNMVHSGGIGLRVLPDNISPAPWLTETCLDRGVSLARHWQKWWLTWCVLNWRRFRFSGGEYSTGRLDWRVCTANPRSKCVPGLVRPQDTCHLGLVWMCAREVLITIFIMAF